MTFAQLVNLAKPYRVALAFVTLLMVLRTAFALGIPWLGGQFAAGLLSERDVDADLILIGVLSLFVLRSLAGYLTDRVRAGIAAQIVTNLRQQVYVHIQNLPLGYFNARRRGDVLSFAVYEPEHLSSFLTLTLTSILPNALAVGGALTLMGGIDPLLTAMVVAFVPLFYIGLRLIGRRLRPLSIAARDAYSDLVATVDENLSMMPAVKAFTQEEREAERHLARADRLRSLVVEREKLTALLNAAIQIAAVIVTLGVLRMLGDRFGGGAMGTADLVSFILYAAFLTAPFSSLAGVWADTQHARGALTRLQELFEEPPETLSSGTRLGPIKGHIVFQDVRLTHLGRAETLRGITLDVRAGETIGLIGPNGAGKSTLVNLLMRFEEPDGGKVLIDGTDISNVDLRSLREQIAILSQDVLLFNASIRDNIAFGCPDASDTMIEAAARRAQAHGFAAALPHGYETLIGDRGVRLSGGQAQRVVLARALLKDPAIIVLDEPTAMFDPDGENAFITDVRQAFANRTVILITHRPGSLALANRIVTLRDGQITDDQRVSPPPKDVHSNRQEKGARFRA